MREKIVQRGERNSVNKEEKYTQVHGRMKTRRGYLVFAVSLEVLKVSAVSTLKKQNMVADVEAIYERRYLSACAGHS